MRRFYIACAMALAVPLSGCFGSDNDGDGGNSVVVTPPPDPPPPPPPQPPPPPETNFAEPGDFGAGFATAFAADPNSDPTDPMDGDIIPVTKTQDPLDVEDP